MTSSPTATPPVQPDDLGTLAVLAWSGAHPDEQGDMPFLLAYSLGDGKGGPAASAEAVAALLRSSGLPIGGPVVDGTEQPGLPFGLLVEAGQAVVTMARFKAQCAVPPEWLVAVRQRGHACLVFTTRPWPEAQPGSPVPEESLAAFAGSEETLTAAAHVLLPARSLRG
ncbi:DUF5949 family protein [Streptomyces sp. NPDC002004]